VHILQSMSRAVIHLSVQTILLQMESVGNRSRRLKGWLEKRLIARLMQRSLWFPLVLVRPSWRVTYLMILAMAQWSSSKVNSWNTSRTSFVNLALPMFITLLFLSNVIHEVAILIAYFNWSPKVGMITSRSVISQDKFMDRKCSFSRCW